MRSHSHQTRRPFRFFNDSGETVPAHSIAKVKNGAAAKVVNGARFVTLEKPDGEDGSYVFTGPVSVENQKYLHCQESFTPGWVKYADYEAPAIGDEVGPVDDEWTVSTDGSGFRVWDVNTASSLVLIVGGGGGGGGGNWIVEITEVLDGCDCMVAKAIVHRAPCGKASRIGDEITIYDDLGCDLSTAPADEWIGVKAIVSETVGELEYGEESPLPDDCDPDDNPYTETDWEACHFSIVRVCCP